jgi:hypothetical protein
MKFNKIDKHQTQTLFIVENFDESLKCNPSQAFLNTVQKVKELNFLHEIKDNLEDICKESYMK